MMMYRFTPFYAILLASWIIASLCGSPRCKGRSYESFDHVCGPTSDQQDVFERTAEPLVTQVFLVQPSISPDINCIRLDVVDGTGLELVHIVPTPTLTLTLNL